MSSIAVNTLLAFFVQAHAAPLAFPTRVGPVGMWRVGDSRNVAAAAGSWKVESTRRGGLKTAELGYPVESTVKKDGVKIWNIVEGPDALMADLKSTFSKPVRLTSTPNSGKVVVEGVKSAEVKDFLEKSGNYAVSAEAKAIREKRKEMTNKRNEKNKQKAAEKAAAGDGEGEEEAPEAAELFTQNASSVGTLTWVVIAFVGSTLTFAVLPRCRGASSTHEEPLLATNS